VLRLARWHLLPRANRVCRDANGIYSDTRSAAGTPEGGHQLAGGVFAAGTSTTTRPATASSRLASSTASRSSSQPRPAGAVNAPHLVALVRAGATFVNPGPSGPALR
jgi:hypothetical protein